jgi:hypothetical protein
MNILGVLFVVCGGAVWFVGANRVRRSRLRRLGLEPLLFDPSQRIVNGYNPAEKRRFALYGLAAMVVAGLGSAILHGRFG